MNPFIVIEGIDGSGKGTIIDMLEANLIIKYDQKMVVRTKEPGGTKLGSCIRDILYTHVPMVDLAPGVIDLLFLASHLQNWNAIVKPALNAGKIVICDRWWYSQFAYMTQRNVPDAIAKAYQACHGLNAGLFIFLHGEADVLLGRALRRESETHQSTKTWNDAVILDSIQKAYFKEFSTYPEFFPIDVKDKTPFQVFNEVKAAVYTFLAFIPTLEAI